MMKRITKKSLIFALAILIALAAVAPAFAETIFTDNNGFSYTQLNGNNASVCDWDGGSDTLKIPLMVNDSYVKEIGAWAFSNRSDFKSVSFDQADYLNLIGTMAFKGSAISGTVNFPAQIQTIGSSAFQGCASLNTLYYNASADIPDQCFYQCAALEKVTIAAGVTKIGRLAFAECTSLSYIWIPKSVTNINATAFNNDENLVIYCYTDSYAHQFAVDNGYDFVLIDAPAPTEPQTEAPTQAPTVEPTQPATEAPTAEPTQPATEMPTESPGFILGDVDNNGVVSISDVTLIQRSLVNLDIPASCVISQGDVDNNGVTGSSDAAFIMRYLINLTTGYPIGEIVTR